MKKMLFGPPGRQVAIPYPDSGMGFGNNADSEVTELLSGGRHVYRAPTTYKTFNMSWKANTAGLQPLIDCYNGMYGPGPFYLTDPTAGEGNLLPPRWASPYQLAYTVNGWCAPSITAQTITPEGRQVVFTGGIHPSEKPSIVIPTIPGKPLYVAVWGSRSGSAGVRVYRRTSATGAWGLTTTITPTTTNDAPYAAITVGTHDTIRLVPYVPAGSTLTLQHIDVSSTDYRSASVLRTNHALNPKATSAPGFGIYALGTGETGTQEWIGGATDGPSGISSYGRWTVTAPKTAGSTGWRGIDTGYRTPIGGAAGDTYTASVWARYTGTAPTFPSQFRVTTYTSGGAVGGSKDTSYVLRSGEWMRLESTMVAPDGFASIGWWLFHVSSQILPVGAVLETTGLQIEKSPSAGTYFDGGTPSGGAYYYRWSGTPNASASVMTSNYRYPFRGGQGVGAVQFTNTLGGNLTSTVVDRIGLSVDLTEVEKDANFN